MNEGQSCERSLRWLCRATVAGLKGAPFYATAKETNDPELFAEAVALGDHAAGLASSLSAFVDRIDMLKAGRS